MWDDFADGSRVSQRQQSAFLGTNVWQLLLNRALYSAQRTLGNSSLPFPCTSKWSFGSVMLQVSRLIGGSSERMASDVNFPRTPSWEQNCWCRCRLGLIHIFFTDSWQSTGKSYLSVSWSLHPYNIENMCNMKTHHKLLWWLACKHLRMNVWWCRAASCGRHLLPSRVYQTICKISDMDTSLWLCSR